VITRDCAGGIVFFGEKVLLLCNDKGEWIFPKGVTRHGEKSVTVAEESLRREAKVEAKIIAPLGRTRYEFFSRSRGAPVQNRVVWYLMRVLEDTVLPSVEQGFLEGGFYEISEAMKKITYSQDKALLLTAAQRYKELSH